MNHTPIVPMRDETWVRQRIVQLHATLENANDDQRRRTENKLEHLYAALEAIGQREEADR